MFIFAFRYQSSSYSHSSGTKKKLIYVENKFAETPLHSLIPTLKERQKLQLIVILVDIELTSVQNCSFTFIYF